jgi:hypothetical protein
MSLRSAPEPNAMLEDAIDPRPQDDEFSRFLAARAAERLHRSTIEWWLRSWHDQKSVWTNLRNIEHWIERSRR